MSYIFQPRRGKKATMNGSKAGTVLGSGEFFIEYPNAGVGKGKCKIKMGDGSTPYSSLPYALGEIYELKADASTTNPNITLSDDIGNSHSVNFTGAGATTVKSDGNGNITISSTDTVYTHPDSGVTAGTYKSVTVNKQGHVTSGTNPTTLAGYGITDAAAKEHTHESDDIVSLDASKLTGTIDIARLPAGALERLVNVANQTARFKLTTASVQLGDTVREVDTGLMYYVVDTNNLGNANGYQPYTAGAATSVPWSGVTGKPTEFTPASHTHDDRYYTETEINNLLADKSDGDHTHTLTDVTDAGDAAAKDVIDATAAQAIGTSTNLITARKVYYGTPKINNSKTYTSSTSIYAPTGAGTAGQMLVSSGGTAAPVWKDVAEILDTQTFDFGDEG